MSTSRCFVFPGHRCRRGLGLVLAALVAALPTGCDQTTEADFVARAKKLQESGNLRASAIELKNALGKNPDNPGARRLLGLVMLQMGNAPAAEKELKRARELGVAAETSALPLAEAFLVQGKYQDILDLGDAPESLSPSDRATFLAYRGDAWLGSKNSDRARADYEKSLTLDNRSSRAKAGLAKLAAADRDFREAHRLLAEALEADADNGSLWQLQGQLFHEERKLAEAESSYSKAIEKDRANEVDLAMRAIIRTEMNKVHEAEGDVQELKKKAPGSFSTHYAAGVLAFMQDRLPDALEDLEKAYRLNKQFPPTLYFLGSTKFRLGYPEQADELISRFLLEDPGSVNGLWMLALIKFGEKDFWRVKDLLMPVVKQFPRNELPFALIGLSEFALGRNEEGLKYFQSAVELAPTSPETLKQLSASYRIAGEEQTRLEAGNVAKNIHPDFPLVALSAVLGYIRSGQMDKAQEIVQEMKGKMKESPLPENLLGIMSVLRSGPGAKQR